MSGFFRDEKTGRLRYYEYNEYEERRLRDQWDRSLQGLAYHARRQPEQPTYSFNPYAPLPANRFNPFATPQPAAPPQAILQAAPPPALKPPEQIDFDALAREWAQRQAPAILPTAATWIGDPTPQEAQAVSAQDLVGMLDQMPRLPASMGELPQFDAAFDQLAADGRAITYAQIDPGAARPSALSRGATRRPARSLPAPRRALEPCGPRTAPRTAPRPPRPDRRRCSRA